jgi:hypothetical protein
VFTSWWQGSAVGIWQVSGTSPADPIPWTEPVSALAISSPDAKGGGRVLVAVGSADGSVRIWQWEEPGHTFLDTIEGNAFDVTALAFSTDGTLLAVGSEDTTVRVWQVSDCASGAGERRGCAALLHILKGHGDRVRSVAFSPDGALLASAAGDGTARLWDVAEGTILYTLAHGAPVNHTAFSPDGALLASGTGEGTIAVWDVADGELALGIDVERGEQVGVHSLSFSPDGVALACKMADGRLRLLGLRPGWAQALPAGGVDVVLVVDSSGDAGVVDPVREAIRALAQRLHFGSVDVGFVSYASRVVVQETSYRGVIQAVEATGPGSGTNTADGVRAGTALLVQGVGPGSFVAGSKVMLLVSSGRPDQVVDSACYARDLYRPNDGSAIENLARDCAMFFADQARLNGLVIHTIAVGERADQALLEAIAGRTGGQSYYVPQAKDLQGVLDEVSDLVFEMVEQAER